MFGIYITAIFILIIFRYDLDFTLLSYLADKRAERESDVISADESADDSENYSEDEEDISDLLDFYKKDFSDYDKRIEKLRQEIEKMNNSPSDAECAPGVYNIPHSEVKLELELEPAIEEEKEFGVQEIAQ